MSVSGLGRFWRCPAPRPSFRSSRGRRGLTPSGPPASLPGTSSAPPSLRTCLVSTVPVFEGTSGIDATRTTCQVTVDVPVLWILILRYLQTVRGTGSGL